MSQEYEPKLPENCVAITTKHKLIMKNEPI